MSISLILIGIISVIVIAGTAFLLQTKNEELTEKKKSMIMLIVGSVIFVSFIVTSMKHPTLHQSSAVSALNYDINHLFFPQNCRYNKEQKYSHHGDLPYEVVSQIYDRNYLSISKRPEVQSQDLEYNQQNLLYLSRKDEGASYFLSQLAETTCKSSHPTLYAKLSDKIEDEDQFVKVLGFGSYQQLRNSLCHMAGIQIKRTQVAIEYITKTKTNKRPYIIIDNFENLIDALSDQTHYIDQNTQEENTKNRRYITKQRLISKVITQLMGECKANIILNSQHNEAIQNLYEIWQQTNHKKQYFPFQFHIWQGMRHYDIYKIVIKLIQKSDYTVSQILSTNKKDTYNFNDLFTILKQVQLTLATKNGQVNNFKRQDTSLKQSNVKISVARYFGLQKIYKQIRSSQAKAICSLRAKLNLQQLLKLQKLNLISIRNGKIFIQ